MRPRPIAIYRMNVCACVWTIAARIILNADNRCTMVFIIAKSFTAMHVCVSEFVFVFSIVRTSFLRFIQHQKLFSDN